jgi:hypothetical protein
MGGVAYAWPVRDEQPTHLPPHLSVHEETTGTRGVNAWKYNETYSSSDDIAGQWSLLCPGQWKRPASSQAATKPEIQRNFVTAALFPNSVQKW